MWFEKRVFLSSNEPLSLAVAESGSHGRHSVSTSKAMICVFYS